MIHKIAYIALGIAIAFVFIPRGPNDSSLAQDAKVFGTTFYDREKVLYSSPELSSQKPRPELSARAYFAYDVPTKSILMAENFDEQLPVASLTKLMTALAASKHSDINTVVSIEPEDINVIGNVMGLLPGEKITMLGLYKGLLIQSSNDAALAIARAVSGTHEKFVELMNREAQALGLANTSFENAVGFDSDTAYSTAFDLSKILDEFVKNDLFLEIVNTKQEEVKSEDGKFVHRLTTTNKLLLEDESVNGIKTGFTSEAKGNLIIKAKRGKGEIITIVLGSNNREEDSKKLIDWIFEVYLW